MPSSSACVRPIAWRISRWVVMSPSPVGEKSGGPLASGGGTSGAVGQAPLPSNGRAPSAPHAERTAASSSRTRARAWVVWRPDISTLTSTSSVPPGPACRRNCADAHTNGRSVTASIVSTAAANAAPPWTAPAWVNTRAAIGMRHRAGSSVGRRPRNSWAVMAARRRGLRARQWPLCAGRVRRRRGRAGRRRHVR